MCLKNRWNISSWSGFFLRKSTYSFLFAFRPATVENALRTFEVILLAFRKMMTSLMSVDFVLIGAMSSHCRAGSSVPQSRRI